jgi:hypothetical protein
MSKEEGFKDTFSRETLKSLMKSGMKSVYVRDAAGRIETTYEAPLSANLSDPCLRTKLKYSDGAAGTSRQVIAQEEEIIAWPTYEIIQVGAGNDIDNVL